MYNSTMNDNFNFLSTSKEGTILNIKLVPNSSFNKIVDYTKEYIRIKISSPPIENRANKELIEFCSKTFDINKSKIKLISGDKSKLKKILFENTKIEDITQKLMFVIDSENK